ncbi:MAG: TIGR00730 family Rossman fold protein [Planctomycetes bacterium]|nr:TIGR00730 family Rossman fold protein [Planctomycetota bacterium]
MKAAEFSPDDFRNMDTWRIFRIVAEFVEGIERMTKLGPSVTMFGSARVKKDTPYYAMAQTTARLLAQQNFNIITGGGPGIMEAANRGARESNRKASVGLNIDLPFEQEPNKYISELITFRYFFVRKVMFSKYADAIVTLPGGFGTMDEFFENLTLVQTKKMPRVPMVLMGRDYWKGLMKWLNDSMLKGQKMISPEDMKLFLVTDDPEEAVAHIVKEINKQRNA